MIVETGANPESDISEATEVGSPRAGARTRKNLKAVGAGRGWLHTVPVRLHGTLSMVYSWQLGQAPSASTSAADWERQGFCEDHASDWSGLAPL